MAVLTNNNCNCCKKCQPPIIDFHQGLPYVNHSSGVSLIGENFEYVDREEGIKMNGIESFRVVNDNLIHLRFTPDAKGKYPLLLKNSCGKIAYQIDVFDFPKPPTIEVPTGGDNKACCEVEYAQLSGHKTHNDEGERAQWHGYTPWTILYKDEFVSDPTLFKIISDTDEHGLFGKMGFQVFKKRRYRLKAVDAWNIQNGIARRFWAIIHINGKPMPPAIPFGINMNLDLLFDLEEKDIVKIQTRGLQTKRQFIGSYPQKRDPVLDIPMGGIFRIETA